MGAHRGAHLEPLDMPLSGHPSGVPESPTQREIRGLSCSPAEGRFDLPLEAGPDKGPVTAAFRLLITPCATATEFRLKQSPTHVTNNTKRPLPTPSSLSMHTTMGCKVTRPFSSGNFCKESRVNPIPLLIFGGGRCSWAQRTPY